MITSSGFQRVNGLRLWVHRFREESVPPTGLAVVLVHGFMDAGATWDLVAPALARAGHDVIAPDLRGFGLSDFVGQGGYYHFPDYVADLSELVDALAPRRLALVGHSMGGTIVSLYAGSNHNRVERLALLEGMGPMATEPQLAIDRMQAWLRTLREVSRIPKPLTSLQEAIERLALHHPRVPREAIESRARLLTRADETGRLVWAYDPLHRTTAPTPFHAEAFKEFLRRIDCPTLVVSGGPAGWHPPDEDERVACLAHATRFHLPHAGHMMHWTEPGLLGDRLAAFFSDPPPGRRAVAPPSPTSAPSSLCPRAGCPRPRPRLPPPPPPSEGPPSLRPTSVETRLPPHAPGASPAGGTVPGEHGHPPLAPPAGQVKASPTRPAAGVTRPPEGSGKGGS